MQYFKVVTTANCSVLTVVDHHCSCCLPWTNPRILRIDRANHPDGDEVEAVGEKQMQAQVLVQNDEVIVEQQVVEEKEEEMQVEEQEEGGMEVEGGSMMVVGGHCWTFLWQCYSQLYHVLALVLVPALVLVLARLLDLTVHMVRTCPHQTVTAKRY